MEPILKEPGDISFTWLEISRTRTSLLQQLEVGNTGSTAGIGIGIGGGSGGTNTYSNQNINGNQNQNQNTTAQNNDTFNDFGFFPREADCEYKCPEIDACISESLWCDGKYLI